jgi:hypothetical protein
MLLTGDPPAAAKLGALRRVGPVGVVASLHAVMLTTLATANDRIVLDSMRKALIVPRTA